VSSSETTTASYVNAELNFVWHIEIERGSSHSMDFAQRLGQIIYLDYYLAAVLRTCGPPDRSTQPPQYILFVAVSSKYTSNDAISAPNRRKTTPFSLFRISWCCLSCKEECL
jgi:hypothetical protein